MSHGGNLWDWKTFGLDKKILGEQKSWPPIPGSVWWGRLRVHCGGGGGMSPGEAPGVPNGGSFLVRAAPRWKGRARRWGFPPLEDLRQTQKAHGMSC